MLCVLVAAVAFAMPAATDPVAAAPARAAASVVHLQRAVGDLVVDGLLSTADPIAADVAVTAAVAEIGRVQALFSPDSGALAALTAAAGEAIILEPEVFAVLVEVQRVARLSKGAFDPTVAAYVDAWAFDVAVDGPRTVAAPELLSERKALVGLDVLVLDPVRRTARLTVAGARLDVADAVVGYALDRARGVMIDAGIKGFVLNIDGNVVGHGLKGDKPWLVGVQDPRGASPFLTLPLDEKGLGGAVMTVSDADDAFFVNGLRHHRHLDPRSGQPARLVRSATVVHNDALTAACLAHAIFVLGPIEGLALAERLKANAIVVGADNSVGLTKGLKKLAASRVIRQRAPTDAP